MALDVYYSGTGLDYLGLIRECDTARVVQLLGGKRVTEPVITFANDDDEPINLTPAQVTAFERAGMWPRNKTGNEYHRPKRGLHEGAPEQFISDEDLTALMSAAIDADDYEQELLCTDALEGDIVARYLCSRAKRF